MLVTMADAIETSPATTPSAVHTTAKALAAVVQEADELSVSSQVRWCLFETYIALKGNKKNVWLFDNGLEAKMTLTCHQEAASSLLLQLSSALAHVEGEESLEAETLEAETLEAAGTIVEAANNILDFPSSVSA